MTTEAVLYDEPGPKARRRIRIWTIVAGAAIVALLVVAVRRLAERDQFSMEKWGPLISPANEDFASVWRVIGEGLGNTIRAAVLAMLLSVVIGTIIAIGRLSLGRTGRIPLVGLVEFLRGVPVVVTIYFTSRVLPDFVETSGWIGGEQLWFLVIGLTLYNSVIFAEIVRAGVLSLPSGQREAALAIGLTNAQTMRSVLLPQAFRIMLPAIISQLVVVLKDTSLIAVVGNYEELVGAGERLYIILGNPIQMFTVIAVIYIAINYTLGRFAQFLEHRLSRSSKSAAVRVEQEATTAGA
ncbi:MAG: amino acid ABC transporter permease [Geodermatophilaceae bacterium]|nr:amino acid ABC transporter permease [Geodermatophilaceae bacterium]